MSYYVSMEFSEIHWSFSEFIYVSVKFSGISLKFQWSNFCHWISLKYKWNFTKNHHNFSSHWFSMKFQWISVKFHWPFSVGLFLVNTWPKLSRKLSNLNIWYYVVWALTPLLQWTSEFMLRSGARSQNPGHLRIFIFSLCHFLLIYQLYLVLF